MFLFLQFHRIKIIHFLYNLSKNKKHVVVITKSYIKFKASGNSKQIT